MKMHIKAITSLITICVMLFTLSVPAFAANKYDGTLHPGGMTSSDSAQLAAMTQARWNSSSAPATDASGRVLMYSLEYYIISEKRYMIQWCYFDSINVNLMFDGASGLYSCQMGGYIYSAEINQDSGSLGIFARYPSVSHTFLFDKPCDPQKGYIAEQPFGAVIDLEKENKRVNLLAVRWYNAPDLSKLGDNTKLSESDFNMSGLEVKITPSLKVGLTEEDRSHMDDGTEWDKDYFDVMVINNTDSWYQIRIKVVGVDLKNKSYSWYINSQEWNYVDKISESYRVKPFGKLSFVDGQTHTVEKQFGNSEWHIVGGHSAYEQMIQWDDLNLIVGEKYQFIVEAVPAVSKYASNLFVNETLSQDDDTNEMYYTKENQYHAYDHDAQKAMISATPIKIYVGTFSIQDAIPYNPNNENIYNGSMSNYTPDPGAGKIAAIEDKNGNVYGYGENPPGVDIDIDPSDVSLSDVKNLFGTTKPFLNFMRDAFATFPAFVWILFSGCMMGCIILRILGR